MSDLRQDLPREAGEVWRKLDFEYISTDEYPEDHENHGFVQGKPVAPELTYRHRWSPRVPPSPADQGEWP
jgi:hypothetical protein